ncbi:hypothetical protein VP01_316g4 [Puccinia sorghi]|uniref:Uncharacterized protein n=1 Tax=Puccinia sorghi TaxID=27349 RepID=A0A0L6UYV8_9BASI|nr:hypothetical protein VP01_316g4 [Puccinia sorghi]
MNKTKQTIISSFKDMTKVFTSDIQYTDQDNIKKATSSTKHIKDGLFKRNINKVSLLHKEIQAYHDPECKYELTNPVKFWKLKSQKLPTLLFEFLLSVVSYLCDTSCDFLVTPFFLIFSIPLCSVLHSIPHQKNFNSTTHQTNQTISFTIINLIFNCLKNHPKTFNLLSVNASHENRHLIFLFHYLNLFPLSIIFFPDVSSVRVMKIFIQQILYLYFIPRKYLSVPASKTLEYLICLNDWTECHKSSPHLFVLLFSINNGFFVLLFLLCGHFFLKSYLCKASPMDIMKFNSSPRSTQGAEALRWYGLLFGQ